MKKYLFTWTYKEDEAYMRTMIHVGSGVIKADFGQWEFEPCSCDQYHYRMAYIYDMNKAQKEDYKKQLNKRNIEWVNNNAMFAITRSNEDFRLYTQQEEINLCHTIKHKLSVLSVVVCMLFLASLMLTFTVNQWFIIANILIYVVVYICIKFALSYNLLEKKLKRNDKDV